MTDATCIVGRPLEHLRAVSAPAFEVTPGFDAIVEQLQVRDLAFIPAREGEPAVADGNRSAIVPERNVVWCGRRWSLSVKGVGARTRPFGADAHDDHERRLFSDESWLGEAPWGAQGVANARQAARVSAAFASGAFPNLQLCPTIAVATLPDAAHGSHRYRRFHGPFVQELRLVPSNVRLYHGSDLALGPDPSDALRAFGVTDGEALDAFIDRFIKSGLALLTLFARSLRPTEQGLQGLWFDDVWLDKDALVAPDGALCFADLEGLDWLGVRDRTLDERIREQFDRKLYEWLFAVDALVSARERLVGAPRGAPDRRSDVALRVELALADDPIVAVARDGNDLDLLVRPACTPEHTVRLRLIDA